VGRAPAGRETPGRAPVGKVMTRWQMVVRRGAAGWTKAMRRETREKWVRFGLKG
jgi:hypothetical protein